MGMVFPVLVTVFHPKFFRQTRVTFLGTGASLSHTDAKRRMEEDLRRNVERPLFLEPTVS
jgi:hypothetical protein